MMMTSMVMTSWLLLLAVGMQGGNVAVVVNSGNLLMT